MSDADDVIKAEWPKDAPPVEDPLEAIDLAQNFMAFVLNLFAAINAGTISPASFAEDTTFGSVSGSVRVRARYSEGSLKAWTWNLLFSAIAITSQAVDRALTDALGKRPLDRQGAIPIDDLADFDAGWTLVYMIRCAFAHDPFNPRWECKGPYLGILRVRPLNLDVDTRARNGQRLQPDAFGGLGGYLSLIQFLQDQLKIRLQGKHGGQ